MDGNVCTESNDHSEMADKIIPKNLFSWVSYSCWELDCDSKLFIGGNECSESNDCPVMVGKTSPKKFLCSWLPWKTICRL